MRETFAVGRVDRKSREVLWLRRRHEPTFPGPWRVRAVVGPADGSGSRAPASPSPPVEPVEPVEGPPRPSADTPSRRPAEDAAEEQPQLDLFG